MVLEQTHRRVPDCWDVLTPFIRRIVKFLKSQRFIHGQLYMQKLQQNMANDAYPVKMKEVVNDVLHPVTKETIKWYT